MLDRQTIAVAAQRIAGRVRHTPLLQLDPDGLGVPCSVILKLELLQHTGSFKPRGAFNRMLAGRLSPAGVVAASGGNHGAAVAYAARQLGTPAAIFVPELTPEGKQRLIASYGAEVVRVGATVAEALEACQARAATADAMMVHPYDQAEVLAGQGTVALELEQEAPELTHVLVAVGGGGLMGGMAAWYGGRTRLVAVEPQLCPALHQAMAAGKPVQAPVGGIAADSLGARQVGALMFEVAQRAISDAVLVSDEAIRAAQRLLWERVRLIVEPGGATALAALHSGAWVPPAGACVGVVVCGANTDPAQVTG